MLTLGTEGYAKFYFHAADKISKEMAVFYNPVMRLNRDISILLVMSIPNENIRIALPLAGTGVRGIRMLKEIGKDKIGEMHLNDHSVDASGLIEKNLRLNRVYSRAKVHCTDANLFLLGSRGFDYIDIDPFGSPNFLLDSAAKRIARGGIVAVTATDTAPLAGTYPETCRRKYWAEPLRDEVKHETALRILIRKAQLVFGQYEKAAMPIFSYAREHYYRVFFLCEKGRRRVDELINQHGMFRSAGPLWLGRLWDHNIVRRMACVFRKGNFSSGKGLDRLIELIEGESEIDSVGFFDVHKVCRDNMISRIPKRMNVIEKIRANGKLASPTHICGEGVKTDMDEKKFIRILRSLNVS